MTPLIAKNLTYKKKAIKSKVITLSEFIQQKDIKKIKLLKIDCEGEEINVLSGIKPIDLSKIDNIVMEINDINNSIKKAKNILLKNGFVSIRLEKESGFEKTKLTNLYASKI